MDSATRKCEICSMSDRDNSDKEATCSLFSTTATLPLIAFQNFKLGDGVLKPLSMRPAELRANFPPLQMVKSMSEGTELPPQVQEELVRLQQLQQTLQAVVAQKQQLEMDMTETDRALTELEKVVGETPVYKSVGSILVKADKQVLLSELKERKELLNTRVTVLGRQEERTRERIKDVQQKLQEKLRAPQGPE
jgi:prefoldin beta subunit